MLREKQRSEAQEDGTVSSIDFDQVLVEVFPENSNVENHAQELFLEINKAEPVQLIDLPGMASAKDRNIITETVEKLQDEYPRMFSPTQRCRSPNVNVENLRNALFVAEVVKRHNLTTAKKLHDWIMEQNKGLGEKYEGHDELHTFVTPRAWKKAHENKFYLGLENTWLYK